MLETLTVLRGFCCLFILCCSFILISFFEKGIYEVAAARNPKGDKSGRGLASLRAAGTDLLVDVLRLNPGSELWAVGHS